MNVIECLTGRERRHKKGKLGVACGDGLGGRYQHVLEAKQVKLEGEPAGLTLPTYTHEHKSEMGRRLRICVLLPGSTC